MRTPCLIPPLISLVVLQFLVGCTLSRTRHTAVADEHSTASAAVVAAIELEPEQGKPEVQQVEFQEVSGENTAPAAEEIDGPVPGVNFQPEVLSDLNALTSTAVGQNPKLARLYREYRAAAARSQYLDKLPDPRLGANVFGDPIETAAGSQRANMNLSQTIPWLSRLDAQQQQACFEAFAIRAEYLAERLRVISDIRAGWYRLYVIDRQLEITRANQELLESLIDVANSRISTANATQGDVLLGTLELSKIQERLLMLRRQRRAVEAEVNRLVGRVATARIVPPSSIPAGQLPLDVEGIYQIALGSQPEIQAARLRTQATRWGVEVARLSRRPEFMLSASYFFTDNNRPASTVVNVGEDPWAMGVQMSVPIWHEKYDAMQNEACWRHQAAHSSVEELADRYEALILDLVAEAQRALDTARLYDSTILPQARQTLSADQQSYSNGSVGFDRVIQDYRSVLMLELGYHQALGDLAIANARIQQAAGQDLIAIEPDEPLEAPDF